MAAAKTSFVNSAKRTATSALYLPLSAERRPLKEGMHHEGHVTRFFEAVMSKLGRKSCTSLTQAAIFL